MYSCNKPDDDYNFEYNTVLIFYKIHSYLKFSVTNFDVVPDSDGGTCHVIYKSLCFSPVTVHIILKYCF